MTFSAERAEQVWSRFVGMFGGDAIKRKYGAEIPVEWRAVLGKLTQMQLERGMRRLVHSGRDHVPTLPAFVRLCESLGDDPFEGNPAAARLPAPEQNPAFDDWGRAANLHLLAHLLRICRHASTRIPGGCSAEALREAIEAEMQARAEGKPFQRDPLLDATPEFVERVRSLVDAKNRWAEDMRDLARNGPVDPALQREIWTDYIDRAAA